VNDFLLKLLGVPADSVPADAAKEYILTRYPQSLGVFVLVAAVLAGGWLVFYLYRREISTCPPAIRITLGVLRTLTLLLLLLVGLGPALTYMQFHRIDGFVVLAIDDSKSMNQPDEYLDDDAVAPVVEATGKTAEQIRTEQPSPREIVEALTKEDDGKLIQDLGRRGRLRVIHFSDHAEEKETKPRYVEEGEQAKETSEEARSIVWPESRYIIVAAAIAILACAIVAIAKSSPLWALVGAAPLVIGVFSLTMFVEQNPDVEPKVLAGFASLEDSQSGERGSEGETPGQPEKETPEEEVFDATLPPLQGAGPATNIAQVIRKGLEPASGGPTLAIVVVSDGQDTTGGTDYVEAANEANERNVPIMTVGVGDTSRQRRIDVMGVYAKEAVWLDDPFELQATMKAKGFEGRLVDVSLLEREAGSSGEGSVLEKKNVALPAPDSQLKVDFKHQPQKEGRFERRFCRARIRSTCRAGCRRSITCRKKETPRSTTCR